MNIPKDVTAGELLHRHRVAKSWRNVAAVLGMKESAAAMLCSVSKQVPGSISEVNERKLRMEMGIEPYVNIVTVDVPEGSKVKVVKTAGKPKRKRQPVYRPMLTLQHRAMLKQMGVTCAQLIESAYKGEI